MIRLVSSILKIITVSVNEFEMVLNLGLEYICGSMNALVESDKVYTYRELRFGLLVGTLAQNPTTLGKINDLHEIRC